MNVSARQLAAFLAVSPRSIGRFEQAGVLARERNGKFDLQRSVQRLLTHLLVASVGRFSNCEGLGFSMNSPATCLTLTTIGEHMACLVI